MLLSNPAINQPGFKSFETELGYLFPALFITVACGNMSGFHSLVASGTTSKQVANEGHMLPVPYDGMLLECVLGIVALIALTLVLMWEGVGTPMAHRRGGSD